MLSLGGPTFKKKSTTKELAQRFTIAGSELLFQEADPLYSKLNVGIRWSNKKNNSVSVIHMSL